jgi:hypothetical protein
MLTRHLDVVLPQRGRAPKTIISYRSLCEHQIFPRWGSQRIDRLLPEYIEDGYAEMLAAGLSASTIVKIHAILSSAYEIEVRRENVARNPCRLVERPRLPQPDKGALRLAMGDGDDLDALAARVRAPLVHRARADLHDLVQGHQQRRVKPPAGGRLALQRRDVMGLAGQCREQRSKRTLIVVAGRDQVQVPALAQELREVQPRAVHRQHGHGQRRI